MPSRPTRTRFDDSVPSLCFATNAMILEPAFSSLFAPSTKLTIGVSGEATTFFSPPLYLTERDLHRSPPPPLPPSPLSSCRSGPNHTSQNPPPSPPPPSQKS